MAPSDPIMNYRLSEQEIAALKFYGEVRHHEAGEVLFREGDKEIDCCIVLSGQLNGYLVEHGEERRVAWLEPGQFAGEISLVTGQPTLVTARMEAAGDVLHVGHAAFHRMLVENSALSDIFVNALLARRAWARSSGRTSVVLVGRAYDREAFAIRGLLDKHSVPHLWVDVDRDPKGRIILEKQNLTLADVPLVVTGSRTHVRPQLEELSAVLGLDLLPDGACADVVIVGAGPAGLASAVYAASEGLSVVTLDARGPGGQAGASSKIENYLGFPSGISGRELTERAVLQAQKFGARLASPAAACTLARDGDTYVVTTRDGRQVKTRAVILACGAEYNRPDIEHLSTYEGSGVYYGATAMEAQLCAGSRVAIVGAGNSAGQGAVFLSNVTDEVHVLFRREDIRATMSEYLVRRLEETPNIHLHPASEIAALHGDGHILRGISVRNRRKGALAELPVPFVFLFVGAEPCTGWLPPAIARDDKGFVRTGPAIANLELVRAQWALERMPTLYETSLPRVYAVGDIRSGSVKRVASSVGEGSVVVQYVHEALQELKQAARPV